MKLTIKQHTILTRVWKTLVFTIAILVTTISTLMLGMLASPSTAAFLFLIIVLLAAFLGDLPIAIVTSFIAALCFDFFYLPPLRHFYINSFSDWISLAAFLIASIIISYLNASAKANKVKTGELNKTMTQIREFGKWLLSVPHNRLTLSAIAKNALNIFSLEYCSIHVYGSGKWRNFTGSASSELSREIESKLKHSKDHITDLLEIADENTLGVIFAPVYRQKKTLALLAVKGRTLTADAVETLAYLIGVELSVILKDGKAK